MRGDFCAFNFERKEILIILGSLGMEEILDLLKDGRSRTLSDICSELELSESDIKRSLDFLEQNDLICRDGEENSIIKLKSLS